MAPDLNSVPPSPRNAFRSVQSSTASSRRTSQLMGPPPMPGTDIGSRISTTGREPVTSSSSSSSVLPLISAVDNTGVGAGPGPLRHPRPLTAADLHLQLEQEQEAVVNRLTRELSLLRQQSASVASTTSSTSTGVADFSDSNPSNMGFGASHPTPSRRHRSSSSLSTRSTNATGINASTVTAIAPARESMTHVPTQNRDTLSRQNSVASSRRSEASSPSLSSSLVHGDHFPITLPQRQSFSHQRGHPSTSHSSQQVNSLGNARSPTQPSVIFSARYEETALHRSELDTAKQENEALRRRIKELERSLSTQRRSGLSRESSDFTGRAPDAARTGGSSISGISSDTGGGPPNEHEGQ